MVHLKKMDMMDHIKAIRILGNEMSIKAFN